MQASRPALVVVVIGGTRVLFASSPRRSTRRTKCWRRCTCCNEPVDATVARTPSPAPPSRAAAARRHRGRKVLRVGYLPDCAAVRLLQPARRSRGLRRRARAPPGARARCQPRIRARDRAAAEQLAEGYCDLVMSGVVVTTDRAREMLFSESYLDETLAFVVPDHQRDAVRDLGRHPRSRRRSRSPYPTCRTTSTSCASCCRAPCIQSQDIEPLFDRPDHFDAMALPAERGSAWTLMYPEYSVVVPGPDPIRVPLAYPIGRRDERFAQLRQHLDRVEAQRRHARRGVQALDSRTGRGTAPAALVDHSQRPALGGVTRRWLVP